MPLPQSISSVRASLKAAQAKAVVVGLHDQRHAGMTASRSSRSIAETNRAHCFVAAVRAYRSRLSA